MDPHEYTETDALAEDLELYDSERVEIRKVFAALSQSVGQRRSLQSFEQQAHDMFGKIGFRVRVLFYEAEDETTGEKFIHPQITILGRIEPEEEFDHARMAHEVQTNVLGEKDAPEKVLPSKTSLAGLGGSSFFQNKKGLYVPK